jgi:hypothetical protein
VALNLPLTAKMRKNCQTTMLLKPEKAPFPKACAKVRRCRETKKQFLKKHGIFSGIFALGPTKGPQFRENAQK